MVKPLKAQFRTKKGKVRFRLRSTLATTGLGKDVNPRRNRQDVFLQLKPAGGTSMLCAKIPSTRFRGRKRQFKFRDPRSKIASALGVRDITLVANKAGRLRLRGGGRNVHLKSAPTTGDVQITVGFMSTAGVVSATRCSDTVAGFRTARGGRLKTP
jgi:hypothetical protein